MSQLEYIRLGNVQPRNFLPLVHFLRFLYNKYDPKIQRLSMTKVITQVIIVRAQ